jgi:glycerophosphoryl diester phosphodiesterase
MAIRPLLLGHRGARAEKSIPENSLASFDRSLARGCDGFEFDVRLSADDHPVICHDAAFRGLEIARCSAEQLALPLLGDVLRRYQSTAFLDIELKVAGLEAVTLDLLRAYPPARSYVISSFLPEILTSLRKIDAAVSLGLICEPQPQFKLWPQLPINYVIPHKSLATRSVITEIQEAGKKVLVWTVNSIRDMKQFAKWGADGIISDDTEKLVRAVGHGSDRSLRD